MLRPDSLAVPPLLGGQLQIKSWKCVNNVSLDRITSITSHSLPVQPDKFYNSNFSCGHLLAIACLSGSFYLVHKLKLDIMQRIDYGQLIKQSELPVSALYRDWQNWLFHFSCFLFRNLKYTVLGKYQRRYPPSLCVGNIFANGMCLIHFGQHGAD